VRSPHLHQILASSIPYVGGSENVSSAGVLFPDERSRRLTQYARPVSIMKECRNVAMSSGSVVNQTSGPLRPISDETAGLPQTMILG